MKALVFSMTFLNLCQAADLQYSPLDNFIYLTNYGNWSSVKDIEKEKIEERLTVTPTDDPNRDALLCLLVRKKEVAPHIQEITERALTAEASALRLCTLGYAYEQLGDLASAENYYKKAHLLNKNYTIAVYRLGVICEKKGDVRRAAMYFQDALKVPTKRKALFRLARLYEQEDRHQVANFYYQMLAEEGYACGKGNHIARYKLGQLCEQNGDNALALHYYDKSASHHADCAFKAAQLCINNKTKFTHYLRLAADNGHLEAQYEFAKRLETGTDIRKDEPRAAHYYKLAADKGHCLSQFFLARMYEDARGVSNDTVPGYLHYYTLASNQWHFGAMYRKWLAE